VSETIKWVIVGWTALAAIVVITQVGKPRKPLTGGTAAFSVIFCALEIAAIIAFWGNGNG
jgi:hypothetical protein